MSDQNKKEILDKPQEEFIDKGIADKKKAGASEVKQETYENMKLEELHRQARLKGVENYIQMDKDKLIKKLKAKN